MNFEDSKTVIKLHKNYNHNFILCRDEIYNINCCNFYYFCSICKYIFNVKFQYSTCSNTILYYIYANGCSLSFYGNDIDYIYKSDELLSCAEFQIKQLLE